MKWTGLGVARIARTRGAAPIARWVRVLAASPVLVACSSSTRPPTGDDMNSRRDAGIADAADLDAPTAQDSAGGPDGAAAGDASDGAVQDEGGYATGSYAAVGVSMGGHHTCALTDGGAVLCWGDNSSGQLGDGTTISRNRPVFVSGLASGATSVATGDAHTCALTSLGAVLCWGSNASGALGDGTTATGRSTPTPVSGLSAGVVALVAGGADTCAATSGGALLCWGNNVAGQLGDGTTTSRSSPVSPMGVVMGARVGAGSMALGADHTCVINVVGSVLCAGDDSNGALGNGQNASANVFVSSGVTNNAVAVAAGTAVSCARSSDTSVLCWGFGGHGELGNGAMQPMNSPVPVSGLDMGAAAIAVGLFHVCAVDTTGALFCWGDNSGGALGDGTITQRATPTAVPTLAAGVSTVTAGAGTCALTSSGAVFCWGPNDDGEVGDGTTTMRASPVPVVGFP